MNKEVLKMWFKVAIAIFLMVIGMIIIKDWRVNIGVFILLWANNIGNK